MVGKVKTRKVIESGTKGSVKELLLDGESHGIFEIDSFEFTYSELRTMMRLTQETKFINRNGLFIKNETSALGQKTKIIRARSNCGY